jgi:hypothetical protein
VPALRAVRPYRQGELDHMCGVYCVVNAVRLAALPYRRLGYVNSAALFAALAGKLDKRGRLRTVITAGTGTSLVARLLRRATRWLRDEHELALEVTKPFRKRDDPQHCLEVLAAHLALPGTAAIVGTADHWTVVQAIGSKRLQLFDSNGRTYLRLEVTVDGAGKQQVQSRLVLPSTFLLRVTLPVA